MSEYWVSKKKYFCKYCDIYIADDAPSRRQHESGLRHKGNLERYIRGIYKAGEKQKKDLEEEKREMKRVEQVRIIALYSARVILRIHNVKQAAAAAHAQDIAAGRSKSSTPIVSTSSVAQKKPAQKPANPFANYTTAASLGYTDPDAERLAAELERKRTQGVPGEWEIVTSTPPPPASSTSPEPPEATTSEAVPAEAGTKRAAEAPADDDDTRSFKLRKKTVNMGELYDPDVIPIKIKKKEEPKPEAEATPPPVKSEDQQSASGQLKWKPTQWKRPGDSNPSTDGTPVKAEEDEAQTPSKWAKPQWSAPLPDLKQEDRKNIFGNQEPEEQRLEIKEEPDVKTEEGASELPAEAAPSTTTGLFKKRKAPTGAGRGRREI